MNFRSLAAACAAFVLSSQASAVTVEHAVMSGSVDAGILIFAIGVVLLVVPKLAKLGVIYMLLADALFVGRILFFPQMQQWLNEHGYAEVLAAYDEAGLQKAGCVAICCTLIGIAVVAVLLYWLWRKFWHRFGFYKTRAEIAAAKNKSAANEESADSASQTEEPQAAEVAANDQENSFESSACETDDAMQDGDMMQALDADAVEAAINKNFGRTSETVSSGDISEIQEEAVSVPKTLEEQMKDAGEQLQSEKIAKNSEQAIQTIEANEDGVPKNKISQNLDDGEPSFGRMLEPDSFENEGPGMGDLGKKA